MSAGPKQLVFGKTAKRGRAVARTGGPYSPFADLYLWSYLFKKVPYHACSGMLRDRSSYSYDSTVARTAST